MSNVNKKSGKDEHQDKNEHGGHNDHHEDKDKQLHIFVNRLKFGKSEGVKKFMGPDDIAKLVDLSADEATVRWAEGRHAGEEVTQPVEIKNGDHFIVVRKQVRGGFISRVEAEIGLLREGGQDVEVNGSFVIYKALPTGRSDVPFTDVMVPIPNGYPASMLDRAALPTNSPLVGRVPGQPQETVQVAGGSWRLISYHPHAGGGGKPWNPQKHGFHSYLGEVLAWIRVLQ